MGPLESSAHLRNLIKHYVNGVEDSAMNFVFTDDNQDDDILEKPAVEDEYGPFYAAHAKLLTNGYIEIQLGFDEEEDVYYLVPEDDGFIWQIAKLNMLRKWKNFITAIKTKWSEFIGGF